MQRLLLFDSGCPTCSDLARKVKALSDGLLTVRSLRAPEMRTLLDRTHPGWRWEPMLAEVDGGKVRLYTGLRLRLRLIMTLGPKRAWQIAKIAHQILPTQAAQGTGRRQFLGSLWRWAVILGAIWYSPLQFEKVAVAMDRNPNRPGPAAQALGVARYDQWVQGPHELRFSFKHVEPNKNGIVRIVRSGYKSEVELSRGSSCLIIKTDSETGQISMTDFDGRQAKFVFNTENRQWVADGSLSEQVLRENQIDLMLVGATVSDFSLTPFSTASATTTTTCYCANSAIRESCVDTSRSWACYCATNEVNVRCSNAACIGCCSLLECDCACLVGDYFCTCGRSGFPCDYCTTA